MESDQEDNGGGEGEGAEEPAEELPAPFFEEIEE